MMTPATHSDSGLVEITQNNFDVDIDIIYASAANFTDTPVYSRPGCYLHADAAELLSRAVVLAREIGYRFRIFDAFRPTEAQWVLWNHTPDPDFLADPNRGSPHSRGVAVDLTLVDSRGVMLEMGTGFDDFTRHTLLGIMTAAGWDFYRNEWWHYQMFNSRDYALISDLALPEPMMPQ